MIQNASVQHDLSNFQIVLPSIACSGIRTAFREFTMRVVSLEHVLPLRQEHFKRPVVKDCWDEPAMHLGFFRSGNLYGAARAVFTSSEQRLPLNDVDPEIKPVNGAVQIGKLVVHPAARCTDAVWFLLASLEQEIASKAPQVFVVPKVDIRISRVRFEGWGFNLIRSSIEYNHGLNDIYIRDNLLLCRKALGLKESSDPL